MSRNPQTVNDLIALLNEVREKYGNIQVRRVCDSEIGDVDEYYGFEDIVVTAPPQSLIRDNKNTNYTYLVFVV